MDTLCHRNGTLKFSFRAFGAVEGGILTKFGLFIANLHFLGPSPGCGCEKIPTRDAFGDKNLKIFGACGAKGKKLNVPGM